jgi:hypothetical protein
MTSFYEHPIYKCRKRKRKKKRRMMMKAAGKKKRRKSQLKRSVPMPPYVHVCFAVILISCNIYI